MQLHCPHCHNPIELITDTPPAEVACPSCGSSFRIDGNATVSYQPRTPQKLGKFDLLETVGQGAFGTVYKARDPELDRVVAIKVPRAANMAGAHDLDRFVREARSVAQLRHPGIVPIHEVGQADGMPYLVSEFVDGVTLAEMLTGRRPSPREAAELIAALADALQAAHDQGIVHRDVKPSNIMLQISDRKAQSPRLMDFGLAKRDAGEITMTMDGQVLGTPAYMSPEQARGDAHRVDARSDVYSLGVILYQMLTGELPFRGVTRMLLHQVLHDEPRPPRALNDRIPRDLETICLKAMAKEPRRRYALAAELSADLRRFLKGEPILARPFGKMERAWRWAKRKPAIAGLSGALALSLLLGFAAVYWQWWEADAARADADWRARQEKQARVDADGAREKESEARAEAEAAREHEKQARIDAEMARTQEKSARENAETAREKEKAAREDAEAARRRSEEDAHRARTAEYALQLRLALIEMQTHNLGRAEAQLDACNPGLRGWEYSCLRFLGRKRMHASVNPFGAFGNFASALFLHDERVVTIGADERVRIWTKELDRIEQLLFGHAKPLRCAALNPAGTLLATGGDDAVVKLWDMTQVGVVRFKAVADLKGHTERITSLAFSPDGKRLASVGIDGIVHIWDVAAAKKETSFGDPTHRLMGVAYRADGKQLAVCGGAAQVLVFDTETWKEQARLPHDDAVWSVAFCPKTNRLATVNLNFALTDKTEFLDPEAIAKLKPPRIQIWDIGARRVEVKIDLNDFTPVSHLVFSPNGQWLASSGFDRCVRLWEADTGREFVNLRGHTSKVASVAFSRDGSRLVSAGGEGVARVWQVPNQGNSGLEGHTSAVLAAAIAPNGKRLATSGLDASVRFWDLPDGQPSKVVDAAGIWIQSMAYSPDGSLLAVGGINMKLKNQAPGAVFLLDAASGVIKQRYLNLNFPVMRVAFRPDGKQLMVGGGGVHRLDIAGTGRMQAAEGFEKALCTGLAYARDGRLFIGNNEGVVRVLEADQDAVDYQLKHSVAVRNLTLSQDGKLLAVALTDEKERPGEVWVWDLATRTTKHRLKGHSSTVWAVAFTPDSKRLISGGGYPGMEGELKVWDIRTGLELVSLPSRPNMIVAAVFSPDGRLLVTGGGGTDRADLKIWDAGRAFAK